MRGYRDTEAGMAKLTAGEQVLTRRSESYIRQVSALGRLAEQEQWEQAEENLYEIIDHIDELAVWYDRHKQSAAFEPYGAARSAIEEAMLKKREAEYTAQIEGDLELAQPDFETYVSKLEAAGQNLGDNGQTLYGETPMSGPQVITAWVEDWRKLHWHVQQTRALQNALFRLSGDTSQQVGTLDREYSAAIGDAYQAISVMIATDTNRVDAVAAGELHAAYVAALAPLEGLTGDDFLDNITPALERLADRAPAYKQQVEAYRLATEDYLRWCERVAAEDAAYLGSKDFPHFDTALAPAIRQQEDDSTTLPGLLTEHDDTAARARLLSAFPPVRDRLEADLPGMMVSFRGGIGLGESGMSLVQYADRCVSVLTLPESWNESVEELEAGLLVDESHPPLTLQAAAALASARRGDMTTLGATIGGVKLRGVTPFFAILPEAGSDITPLSGTQGGSPNRDSIAEIMLRFTLRPHWIQHRYFVVQGE